MVNLLLRRDSRRRARVVCKGIFVTPHGRSPKEQKEGKGTQNFGTFSNDIDDKNNENVLRGHVVTGI